MDESGFSSQRQAGRRSIPVAALGLLRKWVREPSVLGAVLVLLAVCAFAIGRIGASGLALVSNADVALDTLHEGGQLVALNGSDDGYGPVGETWERIGRALAVLAFAAFGIEVLRAIGAAVFESGRLWWRRAMPWLRRHQRIAVIGSDSRADWLAAAIAAHHSVAGSETTLVTQVRDTAGARRSPLGPLLVTTAPSVGIQSLCTLDIDRADEVVVVAEDDALALVRLDAVLQLPDRRHASTRSRVVRVELATPEVREVVRSANWDGSAVAAGEPGGWDLRVWSADELAVRHALRSVRLDWRAPASSHGSRSELIAIGFGGIGRELAVSVMRRAHHVDESRLRITVVDTEADRCISRLRASFPAVDQLVDFESVAADAFDPSVRKIVLDRLRDPSLNPVISVAIGGRDANLGVALGIGHEVARRRAATGTRTGQAGMPIFVRQRGLSNVQGVNRRLQASMAGSGVLLHPWGALDDSCRPEDVLESRMDRRAERIHAAYLAGNAPRPEDSSNPFSAFRPWRELWSFYRDDNRNRADFLDARLASVGLCIKRVGHAGAVVVPEQLPPSVLDSLARLEHRRWTVSRILAGWSRGPRDYSARRHPSICPWAEIDGPERAKDSVMYDLGAAMFPEERLYVA